MVGFISCDVSNKVFVPVDTCATMMCIVILVFLKQLMYVFLTLLPVCVCVSVCVNMLLLLKENNACQEEKPASAVDDTLNEYLITLQHKNR